MADLNDRMKNVYIVKPIVYGNVARFIGNENPPEPTHTHKWTVYVKSYEGEDMSSYIKKVSFKLHESFANATRVITAPPYKVTETGWGEFEITIKIYFHDGLDRPLTLYHKLRLFKTHPNITPYLVNESYDEIIFSEPSPVMYERLQSVRALPHGEQDPIETDFEEKRIKDLEAIMAAKHKVRQEIEDVRKRIDEVKNELTDYKNKVAAILSAGTTSSIISGTASKDGTSMDVS